MKNPAVVLFVGIAAIFVAMIGVTLSLGFWWSVGTGAVIGGGLVAIMDRVL